MKKYVFFVIAILALVVFASGCTSSNSYSGNGVSFNYPSSWQQLSTTSSLAIAAVGDPNSKDSSGLPNTYTIIQKTALPSGQDLKQAYDSNYAQFTANVPSFKTISDTTTTVDGTTAYVNTHTINSNGTTIQEEAVWLTKNGNIYVILCGALPSNFANEQSNFNMIINSFKVQ
ncbi:MAG: PsbP-related protein [Methanobacterium sp.]